MPSPSKLIEVALGSMQYVLSYITYVCPLPFSEQQIYLIIHCPYFSFVQLIIIYITNRAQERSLWGGCSNAK